MLAKIGYACYYRLYIDEFGGAKWRIIKKCIPCCAVVDSVINPLERIPLAAPYADVLRGALEDAEELYVETSSEEE